MRTVVARYLVVLGTISAFALSADSLVSAPQGLGGVGVSRTLTADEKDKILAAAVPPIKGLTLVLEGTYRIDSDRPLEAVADLLQFKLGLPISYEDPVWAGPNVPVTGGFPTLRQRTLEVTLPTRKSALDALDTVSTIRGILKQSQSSKIPGEFKVVQFGDHEFSIVADRAESKDGKVVPQVSPLDSRVTFPEAERSLKDTLELILTPIHVYLVNEFRDPKGPRIRLGANNEIARDVLSKALRQPGRVKNSWHLEYFPPGGNFDLTLRSVETSIVTDR